MECGESGMGEVGEGAGCVGGLARGRARAGCWVLPAGRENRDAACRAAGGREHVERAELKRECGVRAGRDNRWTTDREST